MGCFSALVLILCIAPTFGYQASPAPESSQWNGYERIDVDMDGYQGLLVRPKQVANGRPWIWRARFFGHEPQVDLALLEEGFHLAYCDVADLFGSPLAVERWNSFYQRMTSEYQLSARPVLEGMSRGGLIIYNWAAANPDKVACIYADAPVCDIRSWPGGKKLGPGNAQAWQQCLKAYGLTDATALQARVNPIDNLEPLAKAQVPLLHVVGDADEVVPVEENTAILEERYRELGGSIQVIHKPGVGHHPHSLKEPGPGMVKTF